MTTRWCGPAPNRRRCGEVVTGARRSLWSVACGSTPIESQWGAGFGGAAIHTILPDPADSKAMVVAMSTGGIYRTADGGESWTANNSGIKAYFLPDPWPEFGQCVHKVARDSATPSRLYAQKPSRGLPLGRQRGHVDLDRRRTSHGLRLYGPCTPTSG
jgi:hypothetical protein